MCCMTTELYPQMKTMITVERQNVQKVQMTQFVIKVTHYKQRYVVTTVASKRNIENRNIGKNQNRYQPFHSNYKQVKE